MEDDDYPETFSPPQNGSGAGARTRKRPRRNPKPPNWTPIEEKVVQDAIKAYQQAHPGMTWSTAHIQALTHEIGPYWKGERPPLSIAQKIRFIALGNQLSPDRSPPPPSAPLLKPKAPAANVLEALLLT